MAPPSDSARLVQHSSMTSEHYSPPSIVDPARALMGAIDLDPASCELANRTVRAGRFYTREDDGLAKPWFGRVFVNPPGGKDGNESVMAAWWKRAAEAWLNGEITEAVFVVFNLGLLQTSQNVGARVLPLDLPICFPRHRIAYLRGGEVAPGRQRPLFEEPSAPLPDELEAGHQPPHPSAIVYLPPWKTLASGDEPAEAFRAAFEPLGRCVLTRWRA